MGRAVTFVKGRESEGGTAGSLTPVSNRGDQGSLREDRRVLAFAADTQVILSPQTGLLGGTFTLPPALCPAKPRAHTGACRPLPQAQYPKILLSMLATKCSSS